jgi:hypothetical protein
VSSVRAGSPAAGFLGAFHHDPTVDIRAKDLLPEQFRPKVPRGTLLAMAAVSKTQEVPMENA